MLLRTFSGNLTSFVGRFIVNTFAVVSGTFCTRVSGATLRQDMMESDNTPFTRQTRKIGELGSEEWEERRLYLCPTSFTLFASG